MTHAANSFTLFYLCFTAFRFLGSCFYAVFALLSLFLSAFRLVSFFSSSSNSSHNSSNSSCCKIRGSSPQTCGSRLTLSRYPSTEFPSSFLYFFPSADHPIFVPCPQLARIMAVLRQQQAGGLGGGSKLSPSHHGGIGGGGAKLPGADPLPHPGLTGSVADLHQKSLGPYSGL